jgi:hypothetical protein
MENLIHPVIAKTQTKIHRFIANQRYDESKMLSCNSGKIEALNVQNKSATNES